MKKERKIGTESSKSYHRKVITGFFVSFMHGKGLDIGFAGYIEGAEPIMSHNCIGVDINYPGYDGRILPFLDNSQDYVYSSHCLEHISDYKQAIQEWYRVVRFGGHIVTVVPHKYLYEKKHALPSKWNEDHKRFYTPASLLQEFEQALNPNSYRVRFLEDGAEGFDYNIHPENHSAGEYEITLVIEKIQQPTWELIK